MSNKTTCKIILLGESGVGKTCIINRYVLNEFKQEESTIGASFTTKELKVSSKDTYVLDIWDTAGSEKFRAVNRIFYQGAFIVLLVYDITSKESFEELKKYWVEEVKNNGPENIGNIY